MRLFALGLMMLLASLPLAAKEVLRVLAWPGYADADVVLSFERLHDVRVVLTMVSTDDELWKLASSNGGRDFDLLAVNTAELQRYIDTELVQTINLANVPNTHKQQPRFRKHAKLGGVLRNGQLFALPYAFSEMGLIYNRKLIKQAPTSMAAFWDKRYRGQIALYEGSAHNFSLTALQMGISNPFQLSDGQYRSVIKALVALRANRPLFYSTPEEAVRLFRNQPIALLYGNYGSQQVLALQQAGFDVGYVIPREGAMAWLDCWAILRGASNKKLAEAWINHSLKREVSLLLSQRHGLANTLTGSSTARDSDRLVWLQPVEDPDKRAAYWERILSGVRTGMY